MATSTNTSKFETKNTVLTRKINNMFYELMVKTKADMVYIDDTTTLTELLSDITETLTDATTDNSNIKERYDAIVKDAPETFNTFKEVWDYVNINGDPKSALLELVTNKQDKEEGKGLSTNDFTDILYDKLKNGYTREELDEKFSIIIDQSTSAELSVRVDRLEKRPNVLMTESEEAPDSVVDGSCWYQIIHKD